MYFLFCFTGLAYIDVKHLKFLKLVAIQIPVFFKIGI
jgi:hypothetical protein